MTTSFHKDNLFLPLVLGGMILGWLYFVSLKNYLLFHSLIEIFSIVVAFSIFIIAWNTRRLQENHFFIFIGIAYFSIGSLDLLHTLSYKGMGLFSNQGANLSIQLWIGSRYVESFSLVLAPVFFRKKLDTNFGIAMYAIFFTAIIGAIFYWHIFPDCFVEGIGLTRFKIVSEYLICLFLFMAIVHLMFYRDNISPGTFKFLMASLVFTILAELSFTLYFSVYGHANLIGHYFKLFSFYCLYRAFVRSGLVKPTKILFRKLEEKSKFLQDLYDEAPIAYFTVGVDGVIHKANQKAVELFGVDRDDLLGSRVFDFDADVLQGKKKARKVFKKFTLGQEIVHEELQMKRADNTLFWVSFTVKAMKDVSGNILESRIMAIDITQQKMAETALKESEEKFRQIAETIEDVFWVSVPGKNKMFYISPAYEKIWGKTLGSLYKNPRSFLESVHPDDRENLKHELSRLGKGEYGPVEYRIVRPDGSVRWILDKGFLVREKGETIALTGIATDITDRKKIEEQLLLFRQQIDQSNDAIFVINPQTGGFQDVNQNACKTLKYSRAQLCYMGVRDIQVESPGDIPLQELIKQVKDQGGLIFESALQCWDGTIFPVEVNASFLQLADKEYLVAVARDITQRNAAEKEILVTMSDLKKASDKTPKNTLIMGKYLKDE